MANKYIDDYVIKRHKELEISLENSENKKNRRYKRLLKEYDNFSRYLIIIEREQG